MEKARISGIRKIWYSELRDIDVRIREYLDPNVAVVNMGVFKPIPIVDIVESESENSKELNQSMLAGTLEFKLVDNIEGRIIRNALLLNNKSIVIENYEGEHLLIGGSEPPYPEVTCKDINKEKERYLAFSIAYADTKGPILCV